jgi:DHA1 family bicyclomycin/chloramphenicol resistance-like MFS transporter
LATATASGATVSLRGQRTFIAILTSLTALGHLASAVYLPSLPAITKALEASPSAAHATLSVFLLGFAVAQLVYGPLSDQYGRRVVLFCGLAVYTLASVACALSPDIDTLIGARLAQGVGACAGMVIARAIARDSFSGKSLSVVMAVIATAVAIVPGFVPLLGGLIQDGIGWRATFLATAAAGGVITVIAWRWLPESNASRQRRISARQLFMNYGEVLRSPVFRVNSIASAFGLAAMFAFNAASPALFIDRLGTSATEYGIYPTITVLGYFLGGTTAARLVRRMSERRLVVFGTWTMLLGTLLMLALPLTGNLSIWGMVVTMFVFVGGLGIVMPLTSAASLQEFPHCAGTASALLGCVQMTGAAIGSATVGLMQTFGDASLASTMVLFSLLAVACCCKPSSLKRMRSATGDRLRLG